MNSKNTEDRLQRAYQEMVEHIRQLVSHDDKSLKEATRLAQQKLESWKELSQEESEKVGKEVKQDLKSLSDVLKQSKDKFLQQLQHDIGPAKQKTVDTLATILEQANSGLENLQELFQEKAPGEAPSREAAQSTSHALLHDELAEEAQDHQEHRLWHSDHALWLDEIELWKNEDEQVQTLIGKIQSGFKNLQKQMDEHAQAIRAHEIIEQDHEAMLAQEHHEDTIHHEIHEDQKRDHEQQSRLHLELKSTHQEAMVLLRKLKNLLSSSD